MQSIKGSDLVLSGLGLSITFNDDVGKPELNTLSFANNTEVEDIQNVIINKSLKMAEVTAGGSIDFASDATIEMDWKYDLVPSLLLYPNNNSNIPKLILNFVDNSYDRSTYEKISGKDFTLVKGDFNCESLKANANLSSFPDSDHLSLKCINRFNHSNLIMSVSNVSPDGSTEKSANLAVILGTTIPVVVVACAIVGVVVHFLTRKKYEKLLNNSAHQSDAGEPNYTDMESDI